MLRKVLYIDLTREESWVEERQELFESWMGGTGVGIRLLQEECPAEVTRLLLDFLARPTSEASPSPVGAAVTR